MDIKWRGWTASTGVKAISFILVPVLIFTWLCSFYVWIDMWEDSPTDFDFLFVSFEHNNYFYDINVGSVLNHAQRVLQYEDEAAILACKYLRWKSDDGSISKSVTPLEISDPKVSTGTPSLDQINLYLTDTNVEEADSLEGSVHNLPVEVPVEVVESEKAANLEAEIYYVNESGARIRMIEQKKLTYQLISTVDGRSWGSVQDISMSNPEATSIVKEAVEQQMSDFRYAKQKLEEKQGLIYYIASSNVTYTNTNEQNEENFTSRPVYAIMRNNEIVDHSESGRNSYNYGYDWYGFQETDRSSVAYIAFEQAHIDEQTAVWKQAQQQIRMQGLMICAITLLIVIALMILFVGAGRTRSDQGQKIHFNVFDKLYLDVSFILVAVVVGIFIGIMSEVFGSIQRYGNETIIYWAFAVLAIGISIPSLWWLISLVKRIKDGSTIRHTLCFSLIAKLYRRVWEFCKRLWVGAALTVKVVCIVAVIFFAMIMCSDAPQLSIVFAAIMLVVGLLWANRLRQVTAGAEAASNGIYDPPIEVRGGELGKIASSINQISKGINQAIEEKLKSERLKTELITNVSHDIRTPLTSIITYTDLLKNEGLGHEKAPEYLNVLVQKSQRLKTLTDELFEASKAATGNVDIHLEDLDICALIRQCLGELDEQIQASGLDFRMNLPDKALVRGDGKLIWRVMENLMSNVFKYALPQSRVYIDVIRSVNEYKLVVKNISNNALNVEPNELMERFKRGDSARTSEGSGLGLSIVQSFVQVQGGRFILDIDGDLFKATVILPAVQSLNIDQNLEHVEDDTTVSVMEKIKGSQLIQHVKETLQNKLKK